MALLELNDETVTATTALKLSGFIRLGIAQDFAEAPLTKVLARFARAHPAVMIEVKADRNAVLSDLLLRRQLDLALMFGEEADANSIDLGTVPMVWIGARDVPQAYDNELALVVFEPPCGFRQAAINALDNARIRWRLAFSSPSLSSQRAAVEAGIGVSVRTPIGLRDPLTVLGTNSGLPPLGTISLKLHRSLENDSAPLRKFRDILIESVSEMINVEADAGPAHELAEIIERQHNCSGLAKPLVW
jgi:DNA-binding transcriptional LysR family regulator